MKALITHSMQIRRGRSRAGPLFFRRVEACLDHFVRLLVLGYGFYTKGAGSALYNEGVSKRPPREYGFYTG